MCACLRLFFSTFMFFFLCAPFDSSLLEVVLHFPFLSFSVTFLRPVQQQQQQQLQQQHRGDVHGGVMRPVILRAATNHAAASPTNPVVQKPMQTQVGFCLFPLMLLFWFSSAWFILLDLSLQNFRFSIFSICNPFSYRATLKTTAPPPPV